MSIRVQNLSKIYGSQKALDSVTFNAEQGEVLGFLGPNGAGKSTTMKIITGYIPASSGIAEVCGMNVENKPKDIKRKIGYLPEHNPLYLDMYVREYLAFSARLYDLKRSRLTSRLNEIIDMVGLTVEQNKQIGALSKGYRQRVGLAQALIHDPEVLVLDEPTTGLDPNQIVEIRDLIKRMSSDKTVILSTHLMQEVQALCDRVVIIDKGQIVANDKMNELQSRKEEVATLIIEFDAEVAIEELKLIEGVRSAQHLEKFQYEIKAATTDDVRPKLFDFASDNNLKLLGLSQQQVTMENVFQELTAKKG